MTWLMSMCAVMWSRNVYMKSWSSMWISIETFPVHCSFGICLEMSCASFSLNTLQMKFADQQVHVFFQWGMWVLSTRLTYIVGTIEVGTYLQDCTKTFFQPWNTLITSAPSPDMAFLSSLFECSMWRSRDISSPSFALTNLDHFNIYCNMLRQSIAL